MIYVIWSAANALALTGTAAHECVSEDALVHLKSYKYSSVDKSLISHYILRHYVRLPSASLAQINAKVDLATSGTAL